MVNKGKTLDTYALSSSEIQLGYRYHVNETHTLIPKIDFTSTSSGVMYTPQLGLQSNWDYGIFTELKYKHEITVPSNSTKYIKQKSQYQAKVGYKATKALTFQLEYDYHKGLDDQYYWDKHDFKHEIEFKTYYKVAPGITPYITFAGVPVGATVSGYQLRYRLGLLYSF
ncbi:oligogalacturonate-specific porin KdgM family protein [Vibrio artabrorum]|uniref:Oligogalacturonate-specific porin KdgM family protein n=1 Tax=Vibrio artabrorum TaxID=446374 RepID=A0ABT8CLM5_9VIBR|nr:oligogalacturonate-specific porin KdgM family protein [Vibrio artabrorum]MDN3702348.1 oligogalacturonate-specific porin KdgM family protein [Vibrio artabrorum]